MSELALAPATTAPSGPDAGLRVVPEPSVPAPPVAARFEIPTYELSAALALERELSISHTFAQVLVRRGLGDAQAAREFLEPREQHDPAAFGGIDSALEVIERHVRAGSRITVHGDYDVDGVCATAVMVRALRALGARVDWFLPDRIEDGYGLSADTVRRLAARGCELLITVDCAITAIAEVSLARAAGLDVVVSDHHAPRKNGELPECPIVHPAVCGYPCAELCGTGVAHKLAQALGAPTADEDIELVALATVADLMPLQGENRRLVREGLRVLSRTAKPGLRALLTASGSDPSGLDAGALGFRLAPRINAAGRLRRADGALELMLTDDPSRAEEIAAELEALNGERRAVEQRITWEAEDQVQQLGGRYTFVLAARGWHPGVIGIVASRIAEHHHRPTVLVSLDEQELGRGSGRSIPGFDLLGALHAAGAELEDYGGHRAAAGLTIRHESIESFRCALERHAETMLTPELLEPVERVDAIVSGSELGLPLAEELESLEPCGQGNPSSRLLVPGARFRDPRAMGEGRHLRFEVTSGGVRARAVSFGCNGRLQVEPGQAADATFRLERNFWNGAVEPRLVLRHARRCRPLPIDVLGEPQDYLLAVLDELEALLPGPWDTEGARGTAAHAGKRAILDRRGESPLAVLADALAASGNGAVVAVCADVARRLGGLSERLGGFSLASYHALEHGHLDLMAFTHVVALDPPAFPQATEALGEGAGYAHLAWGEAELRFARQMHELEYGLRTPLVALYRSLRLRGRVVGEELEHLLRGDGTHHRPARLAARLIRVLAELELVSLDRDLPALTMAGTARVSLERSPTYRMYAQRYEDGRRYLSSENHLVSG